MIVQINLFEEENVVLFADKIQTIIGIRGAVYFTYTLSADQNNIKRLRKTRLFSEKKDGWEIKQSEMHRVITIVTKS